MKMLVEFDVDADIVDVPKTVIDNREMMRRRFLKWVYKNPKYRVKIVSGSGSVYYGVQYRSEAFVEWLNKKILTDEKASVIAQSVAIDENNKQLPSIFF